MNFARTIRKLRPAAAGSSGYSPYICNFNCHRNAHRFLPACWDCQKTLYLKQLLVFIWIIRGTPMLVQAFIVYFGFPQLIQISIDPDFTLSAFSAGMITLSLNAGAYLAEIFRGGISAVDIGQTEAARSLGLSSSRTMLKVVLPQAIKIAIPSMVNQFIITIKDTSILSVISLADIMNRARVYVGSTYQFFSTYTLVALYYLVIISVLMVISKYVEKKLKYEGKDNS